MPSQQSVGAQIDARCDVNLAGIDDKVKRIIKDTVKSQSINKEALHLIFQVLQMTSLVLVISKSRAVEICSSSFSIWCSQ